MLKRYVGLSSLEKQSQQDQKVVSFILIRWGCIFDCGASAIGSKCNQEYVKDSSLDTVDESGANPVPLRELVEGLHYCEVQTQRIAGNACLLALILAMFE